MSNTSAPLPRGSTSARLIADQPSTASRNRLQGPLARIELLKSPAFDHAVPAYYREIGAEVGHALDQLSQNSIGGGYASMASDLIELLEILKISSSETTWSEAIMPAARRHPISSVIHQCPFTKHAFTRPRGYPGDAGLIDFVYRHAAARPAMEAASAAGRAIIQHTVNVTGCKAVRRRKQIIAAKIDEVASRRPQAEMLAVACGHLREAESSVALKQGGLKTFVATDQDPLSLEVVSRYRTDQPAIQPQKLSVKHLIFSKHSLGKFDFIYAAGLYDYLDARTASLLTKTLFKLLKAGGRLLIPNFRFGVKEQAYMETYMDWFLLYRSQEQIAGFASEIPASDVCSLDYFEDEFGLIGYLEIERSA